MRPKGTQLVHMVFRSGTFLHSTSSLSLPSCPLFNILVLQRHGPNKIRSYAHHPLVLALAPPLVRGCLDRSGLCPIHFMVCLVKWFQELTSLFTTSSHRMVIIPICTTCFIIVSYFIFAAVQVVNYVFYFHFFLLYVAYKVRNKLKSKNCKLLFRAVWIQ